MPVSGHCDYRHDEMLAALITRKFIQTPLQSDGSYLCGASFSQDIVFAGCSPYLRLSPELDGCRLEECTRVKLQIDSAWQVFGKQSEFRGVCPACETRRTVEFESGSLLAHCSQCYQTLELADLKLRKSQGAGRCFIHISHVFQNEAVPSSKLLLELQEISPSRVPWRYFYHDSENIF